VLHGDAMCQESVVSRNTSQPENDSPPRCLLRKWLKMAVNEIFELNSMFIGDDRERNELEQRSRTLRTAIDQQEGRVSKFIVSHANVAYLFYI